MNYANSNPDENQDQDLSAEQIRTDKRFKKLKRPMHATRRAGAPERLHGLHRRRRKRIDW